MFWTLAVISMFGFALNYALITKLIRWLPIFQSIAYRGFSLALSLSPWLLFVPYEHFAMIGQHIFVILLWSISTVTSLFLYFHAIKESPIGITSASRTTIWVISFWVFWAVLFQETLTTTQWFLIGLVALLNIILWLLRTTFKEARQSIILPLWMSVISWMLLAVWLTCMSKVSQEYSPILSGYIWEVGIWLIWLICSWIFWEASKKNFSWETYKNMLIASSSTVLWTYWFAIAVTLWPLAIAGAIQSGSAFVIALLARVFYKEYLSSAQWFVIILMTLCIIAFRLA